MAKIFLYQSWSEVDASEFISKVGDGSVISTVRINNSEIVYLNTSDQWVGLATVVDPTTHKPVQYILNRSGITLTFKDPSGANVAISKIEIAG